MSSETDQLRRHFIVATILMYLSLLAAVGPFVYGLILFVMMHSGAEYLAERLFDFLVYGFMLLFPLLGFRQALSWRRRLQDRLTQNLALQSDKALAPELD